MKMIKIKKKIWVAVIIYHWFMMPQSLKVVSTMYAVKSLILGLQQAPEKSVLAPFVRVLYAH